MVANESPAETLRRAAKVLREHAEKANDGEAWCANLLHGAIRHVFRNVDSESYLPNGCDEHGSDCGRPSMYDGRYIALMHPPVALALADLFDAHVPLFEGLDPAPDHEVFTLTRAILREQP